MENVYSFVADLFGTKYQMLPELPEFYRLHYKKHFGLFSGHSVLRRCVYTLQYNITNHCFIT